MKKLTNIFKNYEDTGALNENINLFGFVSDSIFMTKSGDFGIILEFKGKDYECLTDIELNTITKRFESSIKSFDENYRIYQYIDKREGVIIPYKQYKNEIVNEAINSRIDYLKNKKEKLYTLQNVFVIMYEGFSYRKSLIKSIGKIIDCPKNAIEELKGYFSKDTEVVLIEREIDKAISFLNLKIDSFISQLSDIARIKKMEKQEAFKFLYGRLNFTDYKVNNAKLKHDTFLDYHICGSSIDCNRRNLEVDDYFVKVLTLKEPSNYSFPLIFSKLMEVKADFYVCSEWQKETPQKINKKITNQRRHFKNTSKSLVAQAQDNPNQDSTLTDEGKEAVVKELGQAMIKMQMEGAFWGNFTLSIVIFDKDPDNVEKTISDFYKIFSIYDAELYIESYNLLNAFFACVPGNKHFNLRQMYIMNNNYADYSFIFNLSTGNEINEYLNKEYLAVMETNNNTPFYMNFHYKDLGHTAIFGYSGSGKSFLGNFCLTMFKKYDPIIFLFELGSSYRSTIRLFKGNYIKIDHKVSDIKINPFVLPKSEENINFLHSFLKVLMSHDRPLTDEEDVLLYDKIKDLYLSEDNSMRRLAYFKNMLPPKMQNRLIKWTEDIKTGNKGQYSYLFDNLEDNLTFSDFQGFDIEGLSKHPQLVESLLFYLLHRANTLINSSEISDKLKIFFIDEAWLLFENPTMTSYIKEALKTWRKKNAMMVLITQSVDELQKSPIFNVILEACPTKIFLANPEMDQVLYKKTFNLNEKEIEQISTLIPKKQLLIKQPDLSKVVNLNVDEKSYWLYTSNPSESLKREKYFNKYGIKQGLENLVKEERK
jgi:type IV secretion system protein VirB4